MKMVHLTWNHTVKVCQLPAQGQQFLPGSPACSATKTDGHYIAEILLKLLLNIIPLVNHTCTNGHTYSHFVCRLTAFMLVVAYQYQPCIYMYILKADSLCVESILSSLS